MIRIRTLSYFTCWVSLRSYVQRADIFPAVKWLTVAFEWFEKYCDLAQVLPERIEGSVSSL